MIGRLRSQPCNCDMVRSFDRSKFALFLGNFLIIKTLMTQVWNTYKIFFYKCLCMDKMKSLFWFNLDLNAIITDQGKIAHFFFYYCLFNLKLTSQTWILNFNVFLSIKSNNKNRKKIKRENIYINKKIRKKKNYNPKENK